MPCLFFGSRQTPSERAREPPFSFIGIHAADAGIGKILIHGLPLHPPSVPTPGHVQPCRHGAHPRRPCALWRCRRRRIVALLSALDEEPQRGSARDPARSNHGIGIRRRPRRWCVCRSRPRSQRDRMRLSCHCYGANDLEYFLLSAAVFMIPAVIQSRWQPDD
jgi:hypothetical protein